MDAQTTDRRGGKWWRLGRSGALAVALVVWAVVGAAWGETGVPRISVAEVEALEFQLSLEQVLAAIDRQFQGVESGLAIRTRKAQAMVAFYGWRDGKEAVALLEQTLTNLEAIHALKTRQQAHAEIKDEEVLRSQNQVLGERMTLLQKRSECRGHLLRLVDLANLEVISGDESDNQKPAEDPERARE